LKCLSGLERKDGDPKQSELHLRLILQSSRAREARKEAQVCSATAKKGGLGRKSAEAMLEIRKHWIQMNLPGGRYPGDTAFARKMHSDYAEMIKNEGSIQNAITRWRKETKSSS
jgi:hypothetical protein